MKKETMLRALNDIDDNFILEAAPKGYLPKEKPAFSWFNARVLAGAFAVLLMAIVMPRLMKPASNTPDNPNVQLVNPNQNVQSLLDAAEIAGFSLECPETYGAWTLDDVKVIAGSMIDAAYTAGNEDAVMHIRKAEGSDDISGDYNVYDFEKEISAGNKTVTVRGDENLCRLIIWTDEGYSYAVLLSEGISADEAAELAGMIH